MLDGLHAGAKPDHLPVTEDQEFVGLIHVVEVMRDGDHGRARPGPIGKERHDSGLRGRIEAGGRLIEHEQPGSGEHFGRQARPLHLAPRERSDRRVPHPAEAHFGHHPINRRLPLGDGRV